MAQELALEAVRAAQEFLAVGAVLEMEAVLDWVVEGLARVPALAVVPAPGAAELVLAAVLERQVKACLESGFPLLHCCGARPWLVAGWPVRAVNTQLPKKMSARCLLFLRSWENRARIRTRAWTRRHFNRA